MSRLGSLANRPVSCAINLTHGRTDTHGSIFKFAFFLGHTDCLQIKYMTMVTHLHHLATLASQSMQRGCARRSPRKRVPGISLTMPLIFAQEPHRTASPAVGPQLRLHQAPSAIIHLEIMVTTSPLLKSIQKIMYFTGPGLVSSRIFPRPDWAQPRYWSHESSLLLRRSSQSQRQS